MVIFFLLGQDLVGFHPVVLPLERKEADISPFHNGYNAIQAILSFSSSLLPTLLSQDSDDDDSFIHLVWPEGERVEGWKDWWKGET